MKVRVTVPASVGNTGSALDALGTALELRNEVVADTDCPGELSLKGEGKELLQKGQPNLVQEAMRRFEQATGKKVPPHGLTLVNHIPFGRGLGSSAAALVGGLLAADALTGAGLSRMQLLQLAVPMEGHPDNAAPAIYGGAVLAVENEGRVGGPMTVVPLRIPSGWKAALFIPEFVVVSTREARSLLPREVPLADAVHNHSRSALLVAAIALERPELLRVAMQDRLHQPHRRKLFPPMESLIEAALSGGAWGACLAGAGPSILAIASEPKAQGAAQAMKDAAHGQKVPGRALVLDFAPAGARVEPLT
ncbi:MAG TPA: homoserine kinase [Planctomycetota bacterium]|nr:homoserine kinase [Planctomycetota bacterium]